VSIDILTVFIEQQLQRLLRNLFVTFLLNLLIIYFYTDLETINDRDHGQF